MYNTDSPKDFSFVVLKDIPSGTQIRFTDSGVKADGTFRANEGGLRYTSPNLVPAGTIITYTIDASSFVKDNDGLGSSGFNLSASGDQVIAFQGNSSSPTFIYAVQTNSTFGKLKQQVQMNQHYHQVD